MDSVRPTEDLFHFAEEKSKFAETDETVWEDVGLSPPIPFPDHKCHYLVFIGIISSYRDAYVARRAVMRRTYMIKYVDKLVSLSKALETNTCLPYDTAIYSFFVSSRGNDTEKNRTTAENAIHNDIVELDTSDEYQDLSEKVFRVLRYVYNVNHEKITIRHFMKLDDDSYLRVGPWLKALGQLPTERLYWGYLFGRDTALMTGAPLADAAGFRWMAGAGYILSMDIVRWTIWTNNTVPLIELTNEDQTIGAWTYPLNITVYDTGEIIAQAMRDRFCSPESLLLHLQYLSDAEWDIVYAGDDDENAKWCGWGALGPPIKSDPSFDPFNPFSHKPIVQTADG